MQGHVLYLMAAIAMIIFFIQWMFRSEKKAESSRKALKYSIIVFGGVSILCFCAQSFDFIGMIFAKYAVALYGFLVIALYLFIRWQCAHESEKQYRKKRFTSGVIRMTAVYLCCFVLSLI